MVSGRRCDRMRSDRARLLAHTLTGGSWSPCSRSPSRPCTERGSSLFGGFGVEYELDYLMNRGSIKSPPLAPLLLKPTSRLGDDVGAQLHDDAAQGLAIGRDVEEDAGVAG